MRKTMSHPMAARIPGPGNSRECEGSTNVDDGGLALYSNGHEVASWTSSLASLAWGGSQGSPSAFSKRGTGGCCPVPGSCSLIGFGSFTPLASRFAGQYDVHHENTLAITRPAGNTGSGRRWRSYGVVSGQLR